MSHSGAAANGLLLSRTEASQGAYLAAAGSEGQLVFVVAWTGRKGPTFGFVPASVGLPNIVGASVQLL